MTNVTTLPAAPRTVAVDFNDPVAVYLDSQIFGQLQRVANLMSSASLVPVHLRGPQKLGDCFLVAAQAFRWGMDPFAVAQATYVVSGKLGYEGKLIAAIVNASGKLAGSLSYDYSGHGDDRKVVVSGKLRGEDKAREIDGTVAGWKTNNEQWKKNPDQMLAYRGAREWARRYMPEAVLGIQADEEVTAPSHVTMHDVTHSASPAATIAGALASLDEPTADAAAAETAAPTKEAGAPKGTIDSGSAGADAAHAQSTEADERAADRAMAAAQAGEDPQRALDGDVVDLTPVAMPLKADKSPDVAAYTAAVNAALAKITSMVELGEFDLANKPVATKAGGAVVRNYGIAVMQAKARIESCAT